MAPQLATDEDYTMYNFVLDDTRLTIKPANVAGVTKKANYDLRQYHLVPKDRSGAKDKKKLCFAYVAHQDISFDRKKKPYPGFYMNMKDLVSRLTAPLETLYQKDWNADTNVGAWRAWSNAGMIESPYFWEEYMQKTTKRDSDKKGVLKTRVAYQFSKYIKLAARAARDNTSGRKPLRDWDKKFATSIVFHFQGSNAIPSSKLKEFYEKALDGLEFQPICKSMSENANTATLKQFKQYFKHPQEYYTIWVSKTDLEVLKDAKEFPLGKRHTYPTEDMGKRGLEVLTKHDKATIAKFSHHPIETSTFLTPTKIAAAAGQNRDPDQIKLMNGVSTTAIAEVFWPLIGDYKGLTEWLHRSTFSYGGVGGMNVNIQSSQVVNNIIFGTVETNTLMIRYEDLIKQLVQFNKKKTWTTHVATLYTNVIFEPIENQNPDGKWMKKKNKRWSWIGSKIKYKFSMTNPNYKTALDFETEFDVFARDYHTRLETKVDELVQNYVYERMV